MSLAKVLETDFRLLHHMCHISNDFVEGIRAKLIEKDNNARWKPSAVDEVRTAPSPPLPSFSPPPLILVQAKGRLRLIMSFSFIDNVVLCSC